MFGVKQLFLTLWALVLKEKYFSSFIPSLHFASCRGLPWCQTSSHWWYYSGASLPCRERTGWLCYAVAAAAPRASSVPVLLAQISASQSSGSVDSVGPPKHSIQIALLEEANI